MRSLAARLTVSAAAWIALGAATSFLIRSEQQLSARRVAVRAFDAHAREAVDALADARAAQQAYVAAGQGVAFWMPKVETLLGRTATVVEDLRSTSASAGGRMAVSDAAKAISDFGGVDK